MPNRCRGYIVTVMPEPEKTIDLDRSLPVLEERMNTITESYDRGWKLLEAKMEEATAGMREDSAKLEAKIGEDNARRDAEFAKLREDSAKRDRNMSIQVYAVAFGIVVVILGIGGNHQPPGLNLPIDNFL